MKIGYKLRNIRKSLKYTQDDVAYFLRISQKSYSNIELDRTKLSLRNFILLVLFFDIDFEDFIHDLILTEFNNHAYTARQRQVLIDLRAELLDKKITIELLKKRLKQEV